MKAKVLIATFLLLVLPIEEARAYVEPGSGYLIMQGLGVMFIYALIYTKQIWAWFKRVVLKKEPPKSLDKSTDVKDTCEDQQKHTEVIYWAGV